MREDKIKNELLECTFAPKILENKKKRSPEEYFNDQMRFEQKKREKILNQRKNLIQVLDDEVSNLSFVPNITERSNLIASKQIDKETIFERLSKGLKPKARDNERRENSEEVKNEFTFTPCLNIRSRNMLRMAPVDEILYDDAKRRQKNKNENKLIYSYELNVNSTSEKLLIEKFYKDFVEICDFDNLSFSDLNMVLKGLHMMLGTDKSLIKEKDLSFKLWDKLKLTSGEESVTSEKLLMHLMAIMKYQTSIYTDSSEAISAEETDTLHHIYNLLYSNRNSIVNHRSSKLEPTPSFQPEISLNSKRLLEDTTTDSIVKRRQMRKIEIIQEIEEKIISECTFQPIIISTSSQLKSQDIKDPLFKEYVQISALHQNHRAELLFNFASIEKDIKEDLIKVAKERFQELELVQCTFAPDCKRRNSEKPNLNDVRKCVERLSACKGSSGLKGMKKGGKSLLEVNSETEVRIKRFREWEERKIMEMKKAREIGQERKRREGQEEEGRRKGVEEEKRRRVDRIMRNLQEKKVKAERENYKKGGRKGEVLIGLGPEDEDLMKTSIVNSEISGKAKAFEIM